MSVPTTRTGRSPFSRRARTSAAVPGAPDAVTSTVSSRSRTAKTPGTLTAGECLGGARQRDEGEAAGEVPADRETEIREQVGEVHVAAVPHAEDQLDRAHDRVVEGAEGEQEPDEPRHERPSAGAADGPLDEPRHQGHERAGHERAEQP